MIEDLTKRLETAGGPSRELDEAIAKAVGALTDGGCLPYTESFDAALTLVPGTFEWTVWWGPNASRATVGCPAEYSYWQPGGTLIREPIEWQSPGATHTLALCAAALRARSAPEETQE